MDAIDEVVDQSEVLRHGCDSLAIRIFKTVVEQVFTRQILAIGPTNFDICLSLLLKLHEHYGATMVHSATSSLYTQDNDFDTLVQMQIKDLERVKG